MAWWGGSAGCVDMRTEFPDPTTHIKLDTVVSGTPALVWQRRVPGSVPETRDPTRNPVSIKQKVKRNTPGCSLPYFHTYAVTGVCSSPHVRYTHKEEGLETHLQALYDPGVVP